MIKVIFTMVIVLAMEQGQTGTIIESIDNEGGTGRVLIEDRKARIQSEPGSYMIIDLENGSVSAVDVEQRVVMDMDSPRMRSSHASDVARNIKLPKVDLIKKGSGPVIAGYETTRYQVLLDNKHCFDEYLASKPLENKEMMRFVKMIASKSDAQETLAMRIAMGEEDLCDAVEDIVDDYYVEKGVPMKTVNVDGIVIHEIKSIDNKASFPQGTFGFPEDYTVMTREEMMQRAMQQMSPHMEPMPGKSPEEQQKYQEHMKQQLQDLMKQNQ